MQQAGLTHEDLNDGFVVAIIIAAKDIRPKPSRQSFKTWWRPRWRNPA